MIDLSELQSKINCPSIIRGIDRVPRGHYRIETGFLYPDGSSVDLFLLATATDAPHGTPLVVSDLGQTTAWLLNVQVKPWLSKKRKALIEDVLRIYSASQVGGSFQISVNDTSKIEQAIIMLGQACLRIADLNYTRRANLQTTFSEEFEELLADINAPFEQNVALTGKFGDVRVDYRVTGAKTTSLLLIWSSGSASAAHAIGNEIFRKWHDLDIPTRIEQRVTVFDDRVDIYRDEDIKRIEEYSAIFPMTDKQSIQQILVA